MSREFRITSVDIGFSAIFSTISFCAGSFSIVNLILILNILLDSKAWTIFICLAFATLYLYLAHYLTKYKQVFCHSSNPSKLEILELNIQSGCNIVCSSIFLAQGMIYMVLSSTTPAIDMKRFHHIFVINGIDFVILYVAIVSFILCFAFYKNSKIIRH